MKKKFLLLFSIISLSAAVHAQDSTGHQQHDRATAIKHQRMDMMQQLNLTDEQKASMQKLREEQKTKMDSIRNSNLSDEEKMTQTKALRESQRKAMMDMLTPEQKSKMKEQRTQQMEHKKGMKHDADSTR